MISKKLERYQNVPVSSAKIEDFFAIAGEYPGVDSTKAQLSSIWESVFSRFGTSIFDLMQAKKLDQIAKAYEEYSISGLSDGACAGKRLGSPHRQYQYYRRNKSRVHKLASHLGSTRFSYDLESGFNESEYLNLVYESFSVPNTILSGRPWGWNYDKHFLHAELIDHLYFADIALRVLESEGLTKLMYVGEGSGILSALISNNFNRIESVHYVDLAHFLVKQFLSNPIDYKKTKFHYAETFHSDMVSGCQILINQDSFPEIPSKSLERYFDPIESGNLRYVLSYNQETSKNGHTDFRRLLTDRNMVSVFRTESQLRPGYIIELMKRLPR